MSFWQSLLRLLDVSMEKPDLYSWFHILSLIITVVSTALLSLRYRHERRAAIRKMVLTVALIVTALEVYKQVNFCFGYEDGISFSYQWYAFPFQFCSTPMYAGLIAGFTKKGKVHAAANAYLASYAVFAGLCVMLYPATVFTETVGINVQTMVCHGSMIAVGVCLLTTGYVKADARSFRMAAAVFGVCIALAVIMNEIAYRTGILENNDFNMFFISPYSTSSLPVYCIVQELVPFPLCLVIYVAAFSLAAFLVLQAAKGLGCVAAAKRSKAAVL